MQLFAGLHSAKNFNASTVKASLSSSAASGSDGNRLSRKSGHVHFAKGSCVAGGNAHQMRCHTLRRSAEALRQAKFSAVYILLYQSGYQDAD